MKDLMHAIWATIVVAVMWTAALVVVIAFCGLLIISGVIVIIANTVTRGSLNAWVIDDPEDDPVGDALDAIGEAFTNMLTNYEFDACYHFERFVEKYCV